jgi:hypothetical protein
MRYPFQLLHFSPTAATQNKVALELLSLERHARSSIRKEKERGADDESREGSRNGSRDGGGHADKGDGGDDEEGMDDDDSMPKKLVTVKDKLNGWTPLHLAAVKTTTTMIMMTLMMNDSGSRSFRHPSPPSSFYLKLNSLCPHAAPNASFVPPPSVWSLSMMHGAAFSVLLFF